MLFSSLFSLSFGLIVFCSWRPTVAATLAVSAIKRGRVIDPIECYAPLPTIPAGFPHDFINLLHLCASKAGHPHNLECTCVGELLICGKSYWERVQRLVNYCRRHCGCPDYEHTDHSRPRQYTGKLQYWDTIAATSDRLPVVGGASSTGSGGGAGEGAGEGTGGGASGELVSTAGSVAHTCTKRCTSVNRDCDWFFTGDCKCYAPPVSLFFWFSGDCGPVRHLPKRDLAQQRHSFYLNVTASLPSPNTTTSIPAHQPSGLAVQLASGLLPAPCNSSYVSFACVDSADGIVHEPQKNWLGAVLPADAKAFPPVPERFLRLHEIEEGSGGGKLVDAIVF